MRCANSCLTSGKPSFETLRFYIICIISTETPTRDNYKYRTLSAHVIRIEMSQFHDLYSAIVNTGVSSGFFMFQGWSGVSENYRKLFLTYSVLFTMMFLYIVVSDIYYIFTVTSFTENEIFIAAVNITVLFHSIYFWATYDRIQSLVMTFNRVTTVLTEDDLFKTDNESLILRKSAKFNSYFRYFTLSLLCLLICLFMSSYVYHMLYETSR